MTRKQIPGFSLYFSRHTHRWAWKERLPPANYKELGYIVAVSGFSSQQQALNGLKFELGRRKGRFLYFG